MNEKDIRDFRIAAWCYVVAFGISLFVGVAASLKIHATFNPPMNVPTAVSR